jgi:hypothetical protein
MFDDDMTDAEKRDAYDRGKASLAYENGRVVYRVSRSFYPGIRNDDRRSYMERYLSRD